MCHCVGVGVQTKTTFWGSLPWALFGLAAQDEEIARGVARNCVAMFDAQDCTAMSYTSTASLIFVAVVAVKKFYYRQSTDHGFLPGSRHTLFTIHTGYMSLHPCAWFFNL